MEVVSYVKTEFDDLYKKWAEIFNLDWKLLKAIAIVESDQTPKAIGDDGKSKGLMQIKDTIGSYYANSTGDLLFNPDINIEAGAGFLSHLMEAYQYNWNDVIQAYNLGETKFNQGFTSPTYLEKVMKYWSELS
jgi:soluble lytic murein transglycosylase-like protein